MYSTSARTMLRTSLLTAFVAGALANPCGEVKTVTRTWWYQEGGSVQPQSQAWADHELPASTASGDGHSWSDHGSPTKTTSGTTKTTTGRSSPTTTAKPTADTVIEYSTVSGYFLQDDNSTSTTGFDYANVNFGLINQTYDTDTDASLTQWQRFAVKLENLQDSAPKDTSYKLVFMGRHGEGNHNAMVSCIP
jgi:hypothetical protein